MYHQFSCPIWKACISKWYSFIYSVTTLYCSAWQWILSLSRRQESTLNGMPVHCSTSYTHIYTLIHTMCNLAQPVYLLACFLEGRRKAQNRIVGLKVCLNDIFIYFCIWISICISLTCKVLSQKYTAVYYTMWIIVTAQNGKPFLKFFVFFS